MSPAAQFIQKQCPDITPTVGIILGSGLGGLVDHLKNAVTIAYADIPGYPSGDVEGHSNRLHIGYLQDVPVACLEGRIHLYEGATQQAIKTFVRTLKDIGCDTLLVTNSAGSLNLDTPTGHLVLIKDHINLQGSNPLIGPNDDEYGPRFIGMDNIYDADLRQQLVAAAKQQAIPLQEGVYAGVLGPVFETPAEIQMLKTLGADVVAMSLIPEVIVAHHCGLRIAAISAISNLAAGLEKQTLSHELTLSGAKVSSKNLIALISQFFKAYQAP
jgi:xanthosine phosphorylase